MEKHLRPKNRKRLIILGLFIMVSLITSVLAIWIVSITTTANYVIDSQAYGGLNVDKELSGNSFNSLDGRVNFYDYFEFTNEGEATNMGIMVSTSIVDNSSDECVNYQNDCEYIYELNEDLSPCEYIHISFLIES